MSNKEKTIVYWAPAKFVSSRESWNLLYSSPQKVFNEAREKNTNGGSLTMCPAFKDAAKNIFSFHSVIDDFATLNPEQLSSLANTNTLGEPIATESPLLFKKERKSSIEGHINITYNLGWLFFANKPLIARMTAPYFPPTSPTKGAMLSMGQFDIGKWYRPFNLDYHIPVSSTSFEIKSDDPLFFIEFLTEEKVEMKRYELTDKLNNFQKEIGDSPNLYGRFKNLAYRYQMAHSTKMPKMILKEIENNLLD